MEDPAVSRRIHVLRTRTRPIILAALLTVPFVATVLPARAADPGCLVNGVPVTGTGNVIGTAGNVLIDCSASSNGVFVNAGPGNDRVIGSPFDDFIQGGTGNDFLDGGAGDDFIAGDAGNDYLLDGPGDDKIAGGNSTQSGSELIPVPNSGQDLLDGGPGNDVLDGVDILGGPSGDHATLVAANDFGLTFEYNTHPI